MKRVVLLVACFYSYCTIAQQRYDIIIDEIMADPSPAIGLPTHEWIELKNRSNHPINLQDWRIGDVTSISGPIPSFILQPGEFVIVCSQTALSLMSTFGSAIAVTSFPSLDNDTDRLFIRDVNGTIIHAIEYHLSWYRNELKQQGGWTLEMMDTNNPCQGATNWKASIAAPGGTPGRKNTVDTINNDTTPPQLLRSYSTDNSTIFLVFNEPVDSNSSSAITNYSIDKSITVIDASPTPPLFTEVQLKTMNAMLPETVYTVSAAGIKDCGGQPGGGKARTGLPSDPLPGEWIINEVLFNPRTGGDDYIEYYNNSVKIFDAVKLYTANRSGTGTINNIQVLSNKPYLLFPGDYIAITENAERLALHYLVSHPGNILVMPALPSLPGKEGTVIALNSQGMVTDEVTYKDDWHFPLIANTEGVALERIDPSGPSQDKSNWHSAASTAGYGTPGYKNSQYKQQGVANATIEIKPRLFSPDNDGIDDIITIHYKIDEPGFIANVIIFDAAGRPVRQLARNALMGLTGYWNWDGQRDNKSCLPSGIYVVLAELFNLEGKKMHFKNAIALAFQPR
jgi:hypothetical protein